MCISIYALPEPLPIPINAVPALPIIVRTSAKSTLIKPGLIMISLIPTTPCLNTSSATLKAFCNGVFSICVCMVCMCGIFVYMCIY